MTQTSDPLSHRFVVEDNSCTLTVDLPSTLSSLKDVELDVGSEAVRIGLPGACSASVIDWPAEVHGRLDLEKSSSKFSRKHAHLIVKLPLFELAGIDACNGEVLNAPVSRIAPDHAVERSAAVCTAPDDEEVAGTPTVEWKNDQGSSCNDNIWHWKERPMIKWSQTWFSENLASVEWKMGTGGQEINFAFLEPNNVLKGDISLCVREGKPVVLYELDACIRWQVDTAPQARCFGARECKCRGKFLIRNFTCANGLEAGPEGAEIECALEIDTSKDRFATKFVKDDGVRQMRSVLKQFLNELVMLKKIFLDAP